MKKLKHRRRRISWTFLALASVLFALAVVWGVDAEGYVIPGTVGGPSGGQEFSSGQFRPFGWSADGKFAWLECRDIDGRGGTVYTYTVYDAVEDAAVFTLSDDSFDWPTDLDATVEESWKRSGEDVAAALEKYGVVQSGGIVVSAFPLQRAGDRYTASLVVQNDPSADEFADDRVQSYSLSLSSRNRGTKVVNRKEDVKATQVWIDGYILSPREPRILIVVSEQKRVFEGYENDLFFYGAHLGLGFKKQ
jgi:hypothetical protein